MVKEKNLGVTISADMNVSEQCGIATSNGNQIIHLIRINIAYKVKKLTIHVCICMLKYRHHSATRFQE